MVGFNPGSKVQQQNLRRDGNQRADLWLECYLLEGPVAVYIGILDAHETMDEMAALVTTYGTRVTRVQIIPMHTVMVSAHV